METFENWDKVSLGSDSLTVDVRSFVICNRLILDFMFHAVLLNLFMIGERSLFTLCEPFILSE